MPTSADASTAASDETADSTGGVDEPDPSEFVFDQSELRTFSLVIAPDQWAAMNAAPWEEMYVEGALVYEGVTYSPIGVRYKGGYGSLYWCFDEMGNQVCPKLSIKLDFAEYDPDIRFYGLKRLNLHAMTGDPSKLHDRLGYNLFRDFDVIAPRAVHGRVVINDELIGLHVVVEQIDGRFTASRFAAEGGDGNLYKEVWPVHLAEQPYLDALQTNEDQQPSAAKMVAFADAIMAGGDAGFPAVIDAWMDTDALMRYIAVDRAIDNWDGIVGMYGLPAGNHNYYWYEEETANRVHLIPWDLDHSFDSPNPLIANWGTPAWNETTPDCSPTSVFFGVNRYPAMCDPFIRGVANELRDRWIAESQTFIDTLFTPAELEARIDAYVAQIEPHVQDDPDLDYAEWTAEVDELRADVLALRAAVQAEIDAP